MMESWKQWIWLMNGFGILYSQLMLQILKEQHTSLHFRSFWMLYGFWLDVFLEWYRNSTGILKYVRTVPGFSVVCKAYLLSFTWLSVSYTYWNTDARIARSHHPRCQASRWCGSASPAPPALPPHSRCQQAVEAGWPSPPPLSVGNRVAVTSDTLAE